MKSENPIINQILDAYKPIWSINHASSLMGWDFETFMPPKATEERGVADSQLHLLHKQLLLSKDFVALVESGKKQQNLSDAEKGIIRVLDRGLIKQLRYLYDITKDPAVEQYGHRFYQKKHEARKCSGAKNRNQRGQERA